MLVSKNLCPKVPKFGTAINTVMRIWGLFKTKIDYAE